ncbi:hypothetical protein VNO78_04345 [Psophocarpus tetragonolobus]|uniref:Uncharacterized protein n=1 Tax=Psophocarpus tetragonolobus TaxID=3891 RepID=A0AAN9T4G4_PSOTE
MRQPEVWGHGSIVIFLIIVAILLFGPLVMGFPSSPGIPLLLVFPVVLAAVITFLLRGPLDQDDEFGVVAWFAYWPKRLYKHLSSYSHYLGNHTDKVFNDKTCENQ